MLPKCTCVVFGCVVRTTGVSSQLAVVSFSAFLYFTHTLTDQPFYHVSVSFSVCLCFTTTSVRRLWPGMAPITSTHHLLTGRLHGTNHKCKGGWEMSSTRCPGRRNSRFSGGVALSATILPSIIVRITSNMQNAP